ncbi:MAG: Thiopurine S-methyltransferase (TPMT) [Bacteroidetes bacterium]|nr:MAG: Thiopurine S-methyltransferase (TPMT) [Bacteroidota bacterium]
MTLPALDKNYWNDRYLNRDAAWDIGYPSGPLKGYIDRLTDKNTKILIPGAGNAYEAEYLWNQGFTNTYVMDIAPVALEQFHQRVSAFPEKQLICDDFFTHAETYDLILEQTFFCAIDPAIRPAYARKMAELLNPGGKLAGVLFNDALNTDKPPFGGSPAEYEPYFKPYFNFGVWESCRNSIGPREGREWFMVLSKK